MVGGPVTSRRDQLHQAPPRPGLDLSSFPSKRLAPGRLWYRQHRLPPWFFSSGPGGRFNLDAPRGTCYLASSPKAAAREYIGVDVARAGFVAAELLRTRRVSELLLPQEITAAHLQDRHALPFGVISNELCHMSPYDIPRAWARTLDEAGFEGVWHTLRFSTARDRGLALFGHAGHADWPEDSQPRTLREVVESMSIRVIDAPTSAQLTVIDPRTS